MIKILSTAFMGMSLMISAQIRTDLPATNQEAESSRWTFGGYAGFGGSFGGYSGSTLYVSPKVGYKATENLEAGLAGNLSWSNSKYYSSTMVGIGPFVNYYFSRRFYLGGMFQEYFVNQKDKSDGVKYSGNEEALYLGGGYMQKMGERTFMQIGGMYNVLYKKDKSVFAGGFVPSIGIVYGL